MTSWKLAVENNFTERIRFSINIIYLRHIYSCHGWMNLALSWCDVTMQHRTVKTFDRGGGLQRLEGGTGGALQRLEGGTGGELQRQLTSVHKWAVKEWLIFVTASWSKIYAAFKFTSAEDLAQPSNQWRSAARCRPGPTTKVPPFAPLRFVYKSLKLNKIMLLAYKRYKG